MLIQVVYKVEQEWRREIEAANVNDLFAAIEELKKQAIESPSTQGMHSELEDENVSIEDIIDIEDIEEEELTELLAKVFP